MAALAQPDVLDLRHFSAAAMRPLLEEESREWERVLHWDYRSSIELLLGYLNQHILPGYCLLRNGRPVAYAFAVYEGTKAVIGNVFAGAGAPVGAEALLLTHLLETLQASPGVDRIEAQPLITAEGHLTAVFARHGFRVYRRMMLEAPLGRAASPIAQEPPRGFRIRRWEELDFARAAQLIHDCYAGHIDSEINQQYRTAVGAQRFLHNIIRFPGCGFFDAPTSRIATNEADAAELAGMLLCSRVRDDTAHITQLCVLPEHRHRGLALSLLDAACAKLRHDGFTAVTLTVTEANRAAMEFYRRQNFTVRHTFEAFTWDAPAKR